MATLVRSDTRPGWHLAAAALLFLGAVSVGLAGYWGGIPAGARPLVRLGLMLFWLALAGLASLVPALKPYRSACLAFFAVSLGVLLAWVVGDWPLRRLGLSSESLPGIAIGKLSEVLPIVASMLAVNRLEGAGPSRLNLRRGRLALGLALALPVSAVIVLFFFASGGAAALAYAGPSRLLAALPLLLVFALANGFMEELWFRGLFLSRFEPLLGRTAALVVTSLAFGALHFASSYAGGGAELLQLVAMTLVLGLAWGWMVQRSQTLWGAVLSHAAADVFVVVGYFVSML